MRRRWTWAIFVAGSVVSTVPGRAQDEATSSPPAQDRELKFLQGLRERGYHDLALEYLESLRKSPDTPAKLKGVLDYEEGRGLLEEATQQGDLERRAAGLEKARAKLDAFTKANPNHELAPEALVQLARLLLERGQTAALQAGEAEAKAQKDARLGEARAAFAQARTAFDQAKNTLQAAYNAFPKFLPNDDPRKPRKNAAGNAMMDAELQRALVDYEEAQTHEPKAAQRNELLDRSMAAFEDVYKRYRSQYAGRYARTMQGKCYEEKGDLGPAMGIYKEMMDDTAPELRPLQRKVAYFMIIVDGKRAEHPLAVDRAAEWLKLYPGARTTAEGLGVQLELAKNILAQLETMSDADKETAVRRAVDILQPIVRFPSPYKPEAVALLQKFRPKSALNASSIAGMSAETAYAEGEGAIQTHEWDRAIALLKHSVRRADPTKKVDDANKARYMLAFACYSSERYYEAAVLGEHLARLYPKHTLAPRAAEIAIASLASAYETYNAVDRVADLEHVVALANYTAETWPETEQGDFARNLIAEVAMGRGRYEEAARAYESVRVDSPRYLDAQVKAGDAHWRQGLALRDQNKTAEADAESKRALELLQGALKARQDAKAPPTDSGLITNANALAEIHRASGRPKEAIALLDPLAKALGGSELSADVSPLYEGTLTVLLKSHIADGQPEAAIADMQSLEKAGGSKAKLTQLYVELSKSLQKEMDAQKARNDPAFGKTQQAYQKFLSALANSQAGQDYNSLMFAGKAMLDLGMAKESGDLFERVLTTYQKDDAFLKTPGSGDRLLAAELRLAEALRKQKKFADAQARVTELLKTNPRVLEPMLEQGFLLEDWARAEPSRWSASNNYWRRLAAQLERVKARRLEYYEALYHVAVALQGMGNKAEAIKTLKSVMTLAPSVGSPAMKKKYQDLLKQL